MKIIYLEEKAKNVEKFHEIFVCVRVLRPSQQRGHVEPVS